MSFFSKKKIFVVILTVCILTITALFTLHQKQNLSQAKNVDIEKSESRQYVVEKGEISINNGGKIADEDIKLWNLFMSAVPEEINDRITTFESLFDRKNSYIANVSPQKDGNKWRLKINRFLAYKDNSDIINGDDLLPIFIHEVGHLISLNKDQIDFDNTLQTLNGTELYNSKFLELEKTCSPNYFTQDGCTKKESYLNQFYHKFWINIMSEYNQIQKIDDSNMHSNSSEKFYLKYKSSFVSTVASQNPEEDFAETFARFVFQSQPTNLNQINIQKILWFWRIANFVDIRQKIVDRLSISN
jgi:hypothetical protein